MVVIPQGKYKEEERQVVVRSFKVSENRESDYQDEEFVEVFEHLNRRGVV